MKLNETYTDKNIESLDILSHIRLRPNAYIMDLGQSGQLHVIKEILDNSIDELENCEYKNLSLNIYLVFDKKKKEYIYMIEDNGRGIPLNKLKSTFTKQFTSGKFNQNVYKTSSGLLGIGAKASVALSEFSKIFSFRENTIRELNIKYKDSKFTIDESDIKEFKKNQHGIFSIFKPDKEVFLDIDKWIFNGYEILVDYIQKLSIFVKKYNFKIYILNNAKLVRSFNKFSLDEIKNEIKSSETIFSFDSDRFDKKEYIERIFNLSFDNTKILSIEDSIEKLDTEMTLFFDTNHDNYRNINLDLNKITFVNNILINDNESYHIKLLKKYLKNQISKKISDKATREFFLKQYVLPIFYLVHIDFSGAQFVGTTKHAFKDNNFVKLYTSVLKRCISNKTIIEIFEHIEKHITIQFNKFGNKNLTVKNDRRLLLELERPKKFDDCLTKDRDKTELFLVEGESAKSSDGRNEIYQALYTLGGKTLNSLLEQDKEDLSLQKIKANAMFRDIIKILNITPGSDDLSSLKFKKILIMSDADDHGYHIASILIGNFMIISRKLIEDGHIYVVISPLYNVKIPNNKEMLYLRSNEELIQLLTDHIYSKEFHLFHRSSKDRIEKDELVEIVSAIMDIGNIFKNVSDEIKIPGELLEVLYKIPEILLKSKLSNADLKLIKRHINNEEIFYEKEDHILVISFGLTDYIIPLDMFKDIYDKLSILLKDSNISKYNFSIAFNKENFSITYEYSIFEIYSLLTKLKNKVTILRNKGIGSLDTVDKRITCMDQKTRIVKRISGIGDLDIIYGLLGNDPSKRKEKLTETI